MLRLTIGRTADISHLIRWGPLSRRYTKNPFVHSKVFIQDLSGITLAAFITNATSKAKLLNEANILSRAQPLFSRAKPSSNYKEVYLLPWHIRPVFTAIHSRIKKLNNIRIFCSGSESGVNGCSTSTSTNSNDIGFSSWRTNSLGSESSMYMHMHMLAQPSKTHITGYFGLVLAGKEQSNISSVELVLTAAESLRKSSPPGKNVELIGKESHWLTLQDRFIVSGLSLVYGQTGFIAFNNKVFNYILSNGKDKDEPLALAKILKAQKLFGSPERNTILCSNSLNVTLSW
ncbi:aconitase family protein [Candidatus Tremblaya phenacola]|nr:aconitase family protein [Candidatus Tremblaya phenacola]